MGRLLLDLAGEDDPDLIVGFEHSDDAGVYRIQDNLALVQTVDLITPVCDDAAMFGRIAAANALSDIYAMGGRPLTTLNICCFPGDGVPEAIYRDILTGSREKVREAGATLVGGHTVKDQELKYGLAVTGLIDPARLLRNGGVLDGDALVLTKPIGSGVLINGARKDRVSDGAFLAALRMMAQLNDTAASLALQFNAHAATDITGFGLAGHALEMARASRVGLKIRSSALRIYAESRRMVEAGVATAMTSSNREQSGASILFDTGVDSVTQELFFDPQTSGGLLLAVSPDRADDIVSALRGAGVDQAVRIGEAFSSRDPVLMVS